MNFTSYKSRGAAMETEKSKVSPCCEVKRAIKVAMNKRRNKRSNKRHCECMFLITRFAVINSDRVG